MEKQDIYMILCVLFAILWVIFMGSGGLS